MMVAVTASKQEYCQDGNNNNSDFEGDFRVDVRVSTLALVLASMRIDAMSC